MKGNYRQKEKERGYRSFVRREKNREKYVQEQERTFSSQNMEGNRRIETERWRMVYLRKRGSDPSMGIQTTSSTPSSSTPTATPTPPSFPFGSMWPCEMHFVTIVAIPMAMLWVSEIKYLFFLHQRAFQLLLRCGIHLFLLLNFYFSCGYGVELPPIFLSPASSSSVGYSMYMQLLIQWFGYGVKELLLLRRLLLRRLHEWRKLFWYMYWELNLNPFFSGFSKARFYRRLQVAAFTLGAFQSEEEGLQGEDQVAEEKGSSFLWASRIMSDPVWPDISHFSAPTVRFTLADRPPPLIGHMRSVPLLLIMPVPETMKRRTKRCKKSKLWMWKHIRTVNARYQWCVHPWMACIIEKYVPTLERARELVREIWSVWLNEMLRKEDGWNPS